MPKHAFLSLDEREAILRRIQELAQGEFHDVKFFEQTYGLSKEGFAQLQPFVTTWADRLPGRPFGRGSQFSRFALEQFLAFFNMLAPSQAAFRIGMDEDSLADVVRYAKDKLGILDQAIGMNGVVLREDFIDRLHHFFPSLRNKIFPDHTFYCKALQAVLRAEGVSITPQYDQVARFLKEADPDLSHDVDIVTGNPIGLRFTVWLDFGKSFSQEPDKTSALTFFRYQAQLAPFVPDYFSLDQDLMTRLQSSAS